MFGFFLIASAAVRGLNTTERERSHAGRGALEARGAHCAGRGQRHRQEHR